VIAAIGLAVAVIPNLQSSADALPICPQPPCGVTTTTVQQNPTWNVHLLHLQQDTGGTGTISADRSWLSNPVICCADTVPIGPANKVAGQTASNPATKTAAAAAGPLLLGTLARPGRRRPDREPLQFPTDPMPSGADVPPCEGVGCTRLAVPHHARGTVAPASGYRSTS
jgi:hypothetical protein